MSRRTTLVLAIAMVMMLAFAGVAWAQTPVATETPAATATEEATVVATETTTATAATGCPYGDFVDEDGDGICDNREDGAAGQQWGPGAAAGGMGNMMGNMMRGGMMGGMMHMGKNFVDADEDGICDNCEDGTCMHQGQAARQGKMGMGRWGATDDSDDDTSTMGRGMGRGMRNSMGRGMGNGMSNMGRGWHR